MTLRLRFVHLAMTATEAALCHYWLGLGFVATVGVVCFFAITHVLRDYANEAIDRAQQLERDAVIIARRNTR